MANFNSNHKQILHLTKHATTTTTTTTTKTKTKSFVYIFRNEKRETCFYNIAFRFINRKKLKRRTQRQNTTTE